jgi:protein disulfide-isomerase-like protein
LTNENYNTTVNEKDFVFVEYYSPMCGHCISFAADYEKLATYFKNMNANVIIAAVDVSEESEIKKQENIKGFPTFKFYIRGNSVTYEKQRTAEAMEEFIT